MRDITLAGDMKAALGDLSAEIALKDETGEVVAFVVPPAQHKMFHAALAESFRTKEPLDAMAEYRAGRFKTMEQVREMLKRIDIALSAR